MIKPDPDPTGWGVAWLKKSRVTTFEMMLTTVGLASR